LSPGIHRLLFREAGLSGDYVLLPTGPRRLSSALEALRNGEYQGMNVTVPYKKRVFDMCDDRSPEALRTGAVNVLRASGRVLTGHNTDLEAFAGEATRLREPFLVVGAGGASSAVAEALAGREFKVYCRTPRNHSQRSLDQAAEGLKGSPGTVVNATPLGWKDGDPFPVTPGRGWTFMDLNYNPRWAWRNGLREAGVRVVTGEGMLVRQAILSFSYWTGLDLSPEAYRTALEHVRRLMGG
jgi:shikimate dehydrogenase